MEITPKPGGGYNFHRIYRETEIFFQKKNLVDQAHGVVNHAQLRLTVDHDKGAAVGSPKHSLHGALGLRSSSRCI
jgi:hypothetical protein